MVTFYFRRSALVQCLKSPWANDRARVKRDSARMVVFSAQQHVYSAHDLDDSAHRASYSAFEELFRRGAEN